MATDDDGRSQGDVAFARLMDAIETGAFGPGDRLRETELAERLSLSRTPIREALRRLEAEGIVEHRPRIGAAVRTLARGEVVELYEMRAVLERTAAGMAARHAGEAEIDVLDMLNARIAQAADDPARAASLNQRFHRSIHLAARNRFLLDAARALNNALLLLGPTTLADEARIGVVAAQHERIVDAIRRGEAAEAGDAAEDHLRTSLRHRLGVMAG